jgi:hypothetical protein
MSSVVLDCWFSVAHGGANETRHTIIMAVTEILLYNVTRELMGECVAVFPWEGWASHFKMLIDWEMR